MFRRAAIVLWQEGGSKRWWGKSLKGDVSQPVVRVCGSVLIEWAPLICMWPISSSTARAK